MHKGRLEAFSDGVIAIIITIMVLEIKVPHGDSFQALAPLFHVFISYILSFIYIAIYWNNHHHMLQVTKNISGNVLWANMHLLFWLSLVPFTTGWMGENGFAPAPTALYGIILFMAAIAYLILQRTITIADGKDSKLSQAIGKDFKGKLSSILYIIAIPSAFLSTTLSCILYFVVALIWLAPDQRIEKVLKNNEL